MASLQPVPNYAMPFIGNEEELTKLGLKFNPVWLKWFIDTLGQITDGSLIDHASLVGLQGGTTGEYYHLTSARYSTLAGVQSANAVFAGPTAGPAAAAAFRALVGADLPDVIVAGGSTGSATVAPIVTWDAKGRLTVVSSATVTPAIGSITGLGSNVATFLATPSSANLAAAVTDEVGTGFLTFAASGTPTITIQGSGTAGTYTPSATSARYKRIGDLIFLNVVIDSFSTASGGTGDLNVVMGSMPANAARVALGTVQFKNVNYTATAQLSAQIGSGGTTVEFVETNDSAANTRVPISGVPVDAIIAFSLIYEAS